MLAGLIRRSKFCNQFLNFANFVLLFSMEKLQSYRRIRDKIRKEMWYMYRNAENAFAELDFTGLGYVTEQSFLSSNLIKHRIPYSEAEIKLFFKEYNLFSKSQKGMGLDEFKKNFFPHLYHVQEEPDDQEENEALANKKELLINKEKQPQVIEERLKKLEIKIKIKFQQCFESVRKAFLQLDGDHDGYITLEDILKYFGNDTDFHYQDLAKLINSKTENGRGYLNYTDFSKWLGTSIHLSEGFYFRHDSVKNPQLDKHLEHQEKIKGDDK